MVTKDIERVSNSHWEGSLREGGGKLNFSSGVIKDLPYNVNSRFASAPGSNPEELLGAAHAACYTMALTSRLSAAEHSIRYINTEAHVFMNATDARGITHIRLVVHAKVDGVDAETFKSMAADAGRNCIISRALATVPIEVESFLD
jgi:osmotically inducible protein OsmC